MIDEDNYGIKARHETRTIKSCNDRSNQVLIYAHRQALVAEGGERGVAVLANVLGHSVGGRAEIDSQTASMPLLSTFYVGIYFLRTLRIV